MSRLIFNHLLAKYKAMINSGHQDTEEARHLFGEVMRFAPPEFQKVAHETAVEMGLLPSVPDGYDENSEPLYCMEGMCDRLGIDINDVPDDILQGAFNGPVHSVN